MRTRLWAAFAAVVLLLADVSLSGCASGAGRSVLPSTARPAVDCVVPPDLAWKHADFNGGGGGGGPVVNPCSPIPCEPGINCTVFCNELALMPAAETNPQEAPQRRPDDSTGCGGGLGDGGGGSDGAQMNPCFTTQTCGSDPACIVGDTNGCANCYISDGCVVFQQTGYCILNCGNFKPPASIYTNCYETGNADVDPYIDGDISLRRIMTVLYNLGMKPQVVSGLTPDGSAATTTTDGRVITWSTYGVSQAVLLGNQIPEEILYYELVHGFYGHVGLNYFENSNISFSPPATMITFDLGTPPGKDAYQHVLVHDAVFGAYAGNDATGATLSIYGLIKNPVGEDLALSGDVIVSTMIPPATTYSAQNIERTVEALANDQRTHLLPSPNIGKISLDGVLTVLGNYCISIPGKNPGLYDDPYWSGDVY